MKKLYNSKNAGKLAAYSAMAGAFVAVGANEANATVVYNDITDVTIDLGGAAALDMDENGTTDFLFMNVANSAGNWTFAQVIGYWSAYSYGAPSNMIVGYTGPILPYGSALNNGDSIGPDANFLSNTYNLVFLASIYSSVTYGPFANTTDKYMGVSFSIDGAVHYGWVRLDVSVGPVSVTIKDLAYDDVADAAIDAGQTTGGGVGIVSINDNQVSAYSYGNTINVIVKDLPAAVSSVNVFDIDGKVVYNGGLTSNNMSINLSNAATGLYTLQLVTADNGIYTKKLYIQN